MWGVPNSGSIGPATSQPSWHCCVNQPASIPTPVSLAAQVCLRASCKSTVLLLPSLSLPLSSFPCFLVAPLIHSVCSFTAPATNRPATAPGGQYVSTLPQKSGVAVRVQAADGGRLTTAAAPPSFVKRQVQSTATALKTGEAAQCRASPSSVAIHVVPNCRLPAFLNLACPATMHVQQS